MSLFGVLQLANNAMRSHMIGLQVVGQNIANANTPGYSREEVLLAPAPVQRVGNLTLGLGVQVDGVVQKVDRFLDERLRASTSDRSASETQEQAYQQLEGVMGELSEQDLSTSFNKFFASVNEILNQPESLGVRNLAALQGRTLAGDINRLGQRVGEMRANSNDQIAKMATDINRLTEEIRQLNVRIASTESSDVSKSQAVGLRDQRAKKLTDLAELIDIRVEEQTSGAVNIFVNGDFLVVDGIARKVTTAFQPGEGLSKAEIRIQDTDSKLNVKSGQLAGLYAARDDILGKYLSDLDQLANSFIFEFNKLYSSGQGMTGFQSLTGAFAADDSAATLDEAGLKFTPTSGSFLVLVRDKQTGLTKTTDVAIDLNGLDDNDTTVDQLVAQLDGIEGLAASIDPTGRLVLESDSPNIEFAFANDTSGALAAFGLNTFFTGSAAADMAVNQVVLNDPSKFSASGTGIGAGTDNAVALANFQTRPLAAANGASVDVLYDRLTASVTQGSSVATSVAEGFRSFEGTLQGQRLAVSGVSIDEEAVRMITFQRAYQASARLIQTIDELMDVLVNL